MPYIGGTPEVQKFIKKYKANGHLIDPYSKEWLSSLDTRRNADQDFYCEIDHDQYSEYEAEFGAEFWNHLLILRIDQSNPELIKDLKAIYQPFKFILEDRNSLSGYENHRPNFILINDMETLKAFTSTKQRAEILIEVFKKAEEVVKTD